ncbi:unnamed protein product [Polarella glacialis]|uniref:Uncharacterized protein n=1 Tax=Polarella glacialis TaxID=89957 RepID=A0A813E2M2_POLGL|nr:unnamed protein product [Polarella glacialis]
MPRGVHSDINWDCPPVHTWSSSGLRKFGIERRRITRELQSPPQMPSAIGSNSSGTAGACRKASRTKWFALAQVSQQLCNAALQRAMKPLALRNDCLAWAGRLLAWQSHGQAARGR